MKRGTKAWEGARLYSNKWCSRQNYPLSPRLILFINLHSCSIQFIFSFYHLHLHLHLHRFLHLRYSGEESCLLILLASSTMDPTRSPEDAVRPTSLGAPTELLSPNPCLRRMISTQDNVSRRM